MVPSRVTARSSMMLKWLSLSTKTCATSWVGWTALGVLAGVTGETSAARKALAEAHLPLGHGWIVVTAAPPLHPASNNGRSRLIGTWAASGFHWAVPAAGRPFWCRQA